MWQRPRTPILHEAVFLILLPSNIRGLRSLRSLKCWFVASVDRVPSSSKKVKSMCDMGFRYFLGDLVFVLGLFRQPEIGARGQRCVKAYLKQHAVTIRF